MATNPLFTTAPAVEPLALRPRVVANALGMSERLLQDWAKAHGLPRRSLWQVTQKPVPPAGIVDWQCRPRNKCVSERHFPKSDPVSGQAVALGENPLIRKTGSAGEEVDSSAEPEPGGSAARRGERGRVMAPDIVFTRWPQ